ncbi:MAG: beta-galactosidase [Clostridiales bacterium]|jgi:beta-galactosidase/beta-glucuronidase|nr:beta-galactosidase [Clostridiales bacterium]
MNIPREEHPRPQFTRANWLNLNGEWDFEFDFSNSGLECDFYKTGGFSKKISVPFCPESKLSGIGYTDFIPAVWYRRTITITEEQLRGRVLLHFGAVDYHAVVFVNNQKVGEHVGGYGSFEFDITPCLAAGCNTLRVYAEDDVKSGKQPTGKQSDRLHSYGCFYSRTTGIWQTVWLEFVPQTYIKKLRVYPDIDNASVTLSIWLSQPAQGSLSVFASMDDKECGCQRINVTGDFATLTLPLTEKRLWDLGDPALYDLRLKLDCADGAADEVETYFGLRSITLGDGVIRLNNRPVFQRLVLDQGFYPNGVYTAPSDEALINDIKLSMDLGFNGARLHEKAFEERFLYHADRLGYLVWGEYANWGFDISTTANIARYLPEWISLVERDFNHPALIGWCPFNETWDYMEKYQQDNDLLAIVYGVTKALDPTRPVIDTSGNYHVITDIYDVHDYDQSPETFHSRYGALKKGQAYDQYSARQSYAGQPFFVSEYGGARWDVSQDSADNWGYDDAPTSEDEYIARYEGLTKALLGSEGVCAFCYTQLYDVEQEKNGLYTYDRKRKFADGVYQRIHDCNTAKAAIENKKEGQKDTV